MAIDGVKIIDSDIAHDIYNEFMDLYDSGMEITGIIDIVGKWRDLLNDDEVEHEFFITSFALALWETGNLTEDILQDVKQCIEKRASIKMWIEENCQKEAISRQKVLDKFLIKISVPKLNPRKRKKFKKISKYIFDINDVLTFKAEDGNYYSVILTMIDQYRGHCYYRFTPTVFCNEAKASIEDVFDISVFGTKIYTSYDEKTVQDMQPGIEKFWELDGQLKINYTIGLVTIGIEHRDLLQFYSCFEKIGNMEISDCFRELGVISYEDNFKDFSSRFLNIEQVQKTFNYEKIPISMISKQSG